MDRLAKNLVFFFLLIQLFFGSYSVLGQTYPCYLYGSITTIDGDVYKGAIRWDDEEVFLTDVFNADKEENPYLKYLPESKIKNNEERYSRNRTWDRFEVTINDERRNLTSVYDRKFQCRFGDIKSISVTGSESVSLELKNGKYINLSGGSNDVGTKVWIIDQELGLLKIDWDRIDIVNFETTPTDHMETFGDPIYGKITTTKGEFTGFIQWDHDERLLGDKLDGRSRDGDVSISFDKIKKIEKTENGSLITLHSERQFELTGENDVNKYNRGIIVSIPNVGRVDFPWSHFLSLEILPLSKNTDCLSEFRVSQRLFGTLVTKEGKSYKGVIVYDLDEAMDSEILNGLNDKLEFAIPFRNIGSIKPMAYNYCLVELKNGMKLYLGDQTDVSNKNAGVIIFVNEDEYQNFKWEDIERIDFM
ncbi:hypothetical protein GQR60_01930 [Labilibaculum sp. A4]|uniref:hypothetical protein n=1 Tax=Labilibaculum euxinus TaxID=2686357 RepID=UPI000F6286C7|nr:hypothetical protein [Labilibaculum euxinus]MDQ1769563.1 hypothetical protein [Labilibaculum euxinus]MWN75088.1 hypothetical protein [Labilibaculum euxinus]